MKKKSYVKDIFREYDIRGVVGVDFSEEFAELLGKAFITYLLKNGAPKNPHVTLGQDARLSSPSISEALCNGMMSAGAHVTLLGLVTTPISYYSMFALEGMSGGIMVTGSHNPPDYNGFKFQWVRAQFLGKKFLSSTKLLSAAISQPVSDLKSTTIFFRST